MSRERPAVDTSKGCGVRRATAWRFESPHPASGRTRQTSYWVLEAGEELPSRWRHAVASDDEDDGTVSLCRWEPLPLVVALVDQQSPLLSQLPILLG